MVGPVGRRHRQPVAHRPPPDLVQQILERHANHGDHFGRIGRRRGGRQAPGDPGHADLIGDGVGHLDLQRRRPVFGAQPCLLGQFAPHAVERVFVKRRSALGHFPAIVGQGEPLLAHQGHGPVVMHGQDAGPHILEPHHGVVGLHPRRRRRRVPRQGHPRAVEHRLGSVAAPGRRLGQTLGPFRFIGIAHGRPMADGRSKA